MYTLLALALYIIYYEIGPYGRYSYLFLFFTDFQRTKLVINILNIN